MRIELSGGNTVEIQTCGNNISLTFRNMFFTDSECNLNKLYYEDVIELATSLLRIAREIK